MSQSQEVEVSTRDEIDNPVLETGEMVANRFRIIRALAEGGMGQVYVATQEPMGRKVALKILRRELTSDKSSIKRFFREAVAISKLQHPNTISIIDYGESDNGMLYIAMEYLNGESLHELLARHKQLPLARAVNIVGQIARALSEAHSKGIIHRDLKPENIFICQVEGEDGDFVKVLDFGIAKLQQDTGTRITRMGYVCGTPEYMSPEQARGEEIDGRSDLYSLGVMFWEMLEGDPPYDGGTPLATVLKHQTEPVPEMSARLPASMKNFIYRTLAKQAQERPASPEVFVQNLLEACPDDIHQYSGPIRLTGRSLIPSSTPVLQARNTPDLAVAPTVGAGSNPMAAVGSTSATVEMASSGSSPRFGRLALAIPIVLAVILLLAAVGAASFYAMGDSGSGQDVVKPATTDVTPKVVLPMVTLTSVPAGAEVYRQGKFLGPTPVDIPGEARGTTTLIIKKEGYEDLKVEAIFPQEGTRKMPVSLKKAAAKFAVHLRSEPVQALVYRDDRPLGPTPMELPVTKKDSPFEVEVRMEGYESQTLTIDPSRGAHEHNIKLPKTPAVETPKNTNKGRNVPKRVRPTPKQTPQPKIIKTPSQPTTPKVKEKPKTPPTKKKGQYETVD